MWTMHLDSVTGPAIARVRADTCRDWRIAAAPLPGVSGVHDVYITYENPRLTKPDMSGLQFDWFYFSRELPRGDDSMRRLYWRLVKADAPTIPVMMDNPPDMHRPTHVFEKGNWLVKGALVEPATPHALNPFPAGAPRNRLGMAQWLTSPQNPLTARTLVNRLWEQVFGAGLVETLEDLGTQGMPPTHRELLDYLAWRFMHEDGWSVKRVLREIVLSATYQQDSKVRADAAAKDADDRYYWRAPRVRLSAEQVRDQALAVSGLLDDSLYGPSVMPWQPRGIWLSPWNGQDWKKSAGRDQYRRAVYTYWKRTAPYPSMISFDGTAREVCTARRIRTNTPLQALVLLNDSVYLEAARELAGRMLAAGDIRRAIGTGYERIMLKPISAEKMKALVVLYEKAYAQYAGEARQGSKRQPAAGDSQGEDYSGEPGPKGDAMTLVASALLNLDEVITKN
jgi:hypothetical protein